MESVEFRLAGNQAFSTSMNAFRTFSRTSASTPIQSSREGGVVADTFLFCGDS